MKRRSTQRTRPSGAGMVAVIAWFFLAGLALLIAAASVAAFSSITDKLPPPENLDKFTPQQESVILDRTGEIELARIGQTRREIVTFDQIPAIVIDAQTAVEDKTFWDNTGFDPLAIISAGVDSLRGRSRGASTITQQLVRQRLLDEDLVQDPKRQVERKLKEIVQSIRLTEAFPGREGKEKIITAYLNQNYYGNQTYGVKAAAKAYFGVDDLHDLTVAQAAILAGLPKSPSNYDLVRNAVVECTGELDAEGNCPADKIKLVVPPDTEIVKRRNMILDLLAEGDRNPLSEGDFTREDFLAAKDEEVVLAPQSVTRWTAPHFVWAVQKELATKLCGEDAPTCEALETGGLRITSTLDVPIQGIAEKWVKAATFVPNARRPAEAAESLGLRYEDWMRNLRDKNLANGALVATDYQTGEIIAYVGSAEYYSTQPSPAFQPQFDVAGQGWRQPGSAFKPFNYLTGIDDGTMTAATMFMDSATDFGGGYSPKDADPLERGPVRVRNALQFSLNIPSVKAMIVNTPEHVFSRAKDFGMTFQTEAPLAGPALALGVQEVRPVDLTTAYGTIANQGRYIPHTTILAIKDAAGTDVVDPYVPPEGTQAASPQSAFVITDILAGNTNRNVNPFWGEFELTDEAGDHRPATLKTGTNNDAKDLNAYGFIAAPTQEGRDAGEYALAVGAWNGNSDNSFVSTADAPLFSIEVTTFVWQGFLDEVTKSWAINDFPQPDGLTKAAIDPWTGLKPTDPSKSVEEWFVGDTAPTSAVPRGVCGSAVFQYAGFEKNYPNWEQHARNWLQRARQGPGTAGGVNGTRTAFFYNGQWKPYGNSWGFVEGYGCLGAAPSPTCIPLPSPDASGVIPSFVVPTPAPDFTGVPAIPCPPPSQTVAPSETPSAEPSEPPPTAEPTPKPTPAPTPEPTPAPTPEPTPAPSAPAAAGSSEP
ncbi:MAG TPA: transglycosylase domain-containing protein [Candidatus Limnocylindrales bacterium]|nr:transglycosylase domain-containing protein [Candidatus Limnocylindrales bacterium]